jgi:hypothetical protein
MKENNILNDMQQKFNRKLKEIKVTWLIENKYGRVGETTVIKADDFFEPIIYGANWFQVFDNDLKKWHSFFDKIDFKDMQKIWYIP